MQKARAGVTVRLFVEDFMVSKRKDKLRQGRLGMAPSGGWSRLGRGGARVPAQARPTAGAPVRGDGKFGDGRKFGRVSLGERLFASLGVSEKSALVFSVDSASWSQY